MFYIHLPLRWTALVTYLASPLPFWHASYDHKHRWLYLKFGTIEISAYKAVTGDKYVQVSREAN
jgi:hypothetical protein